MGKRFGSNIIRQIRPLPHNALTHPFSVEIPWDKKEQRDECDESRDVGSMGQEG